MTLETWVKNAWLEKRDSDRDEISRLLALADGRLEDYQRAVAGKLSADVQLGLAYDAIRISATVALRAAGYRVVRGGSEHYRTIEALEYRTRHCPSVPATIFVTSSVVNAGRVTNGPC